MWLNGLFYWQSKYQTITASSMAESKIYATDKCMNTLLHLHHLILGLNLTKQFMPTPTTVHNDNACVRSGPKTSQLKDLDTFK